MTAGELREWLDWHIRTDEPGQWQLNDVELDQKAYEERCRRRAAMEVVAEKGPEELETGCLKVVDEEGKAVQWLWFRKGKEGWKKKKNQ